MCTLSWVHDPNNGGYHLFFNRDEQRDREPATPPEIDHSGALPFVTARDTRAGGTWLLTNAHGISIATLNHYDAAAKTTPPAKARKPRPASHLTGQLPHHRRLPRPPQRPRPRRPLPPLHPNRHRPRPADIHVVLGRHPTPRATHTTPALPHHLLLPVRKSHHPPHHTPRKTSPQQPPPNNSETSTPNTIPSTPPTPSSCVAPTP